MDTLFSKIAKGEIPSYKIAEDDKFYAFLDINPVQMGHTLVIPREPISYLFDIDDQTLGEMMVFAKKIAIKIKERLNCKRVAVAVIGLEVPHAHIHLIPINEEGDMNFSKKLTPSEIELKNMQVLLQM